MKLRTDLVKFATPAEALKEALAQNPRYKPEPLFSQTGTGSLSSASTEECASEAARSSERIQKALRESRRKGEDRHAVETSFGELLDYLRSCHRAAPFLFFNGNTFADIGRTLTDYLFAELPTMRRRQATSAAAHYIAGVLDREAMAGILTALYRSASFGVGDHVKTMRGSLRGIITRMLDDGRVAVRPDGCTSELLSLPESLLPDD